ncbi:hypothetical protein GCM10020331_008560 [Ectobacillus funiculus]
MARFLFTLSDLLGYPVLSNHIEINTTDYSEIYKLIVEHINTYTTNCVNSRYGIVGIVIAIHGLVTKEEVIHYVPRLGWHDIDLKADLEKKILTSLFILRTMQTSVPLQSEYTHTIKRITCYLPLSLPA